MNIIILIFIIYLIYCIKNKRFHKYNYFEIGILSLTFAVIYILHESTIEEFADEDDEDESFFSKMKKKFTDNNNTSSKKKNKKKSEDDEEEEDTSSKKKNKKKSADDEEEEDTSSKKKKKKPDDEEDTSKKTKKKSDDEEDTSKKTKKKSDDEEDTSKKKKKPDDEELKDQDDIPGDNETRRAGREANEKFEFKCPSGYHIVEFKGKFKDEISSISGKCSDGKTDFGPFGGSKGSPYDVRQNSGFNKVDSKSNKTVNRLSFMNENNSLLKTVGDGVGKSIPMECPNGTIVTGIRGHTNDIALNSLRFICDFRKWTQIVGKKLKFISVFKKVLIGIDDTDSIWITYDYIKEEWKLIPGKLNQICIYEDNITGKNAGNQMFWSSSSKNIAFGNVGGVWASYVQVTAGLIVHQGTKKMHIKGNLNEKKWGDKNGVLKQFSLYKNIILGTNSANQLYYASTGSWSFILVESNYVFVWAWYNTGVFSGITKDNKLIISFSEKLKDTKNIGEARIFLQNWEFNINDIKKFREISKPTVSMLKQVVTFEMTLFVVDENNNVYYLDLYELFKMAFAPPPNSTSKQETKTETNTTTLEKPTKKEKGRPFSISNINDPIPVLAFSEIQNRITDLNEFERKSGSFMPLTTVAPTIFYEQDTNEELKKKINNMLKYTTLKRACCTNYKNNSTLAINVPTFSPVDPSTLRDSAKRLYDTYKMYNQTINVPSELCNMPELQDFTPGGDKCNAFYEIYCRNAEKHFDRITLPKDQNYANWAAYKPDCSCFGKYVPPIFDPKNNRNLNFDADGSQPVRCYLSSCDNNYYDYNSRDKNDKTKGRECKTLSICINNTNIGDIKANNVNIKMENKQDCDVKSNTENKKSLPGAEENKTSNTKPTKTKSTKTKSTKTKSTKKPKKDDYKLPSPKINIPCVIL